MINLDREAAAAAQKIVGSLWSQSVRTLTKEDREKLQKEAQALENLVTKALGVVQEHGVYAGMLYLYSRSKTDQPHAKATRDPLLELLTVIGFGQPATPATWDTVDWTIVEKFLRNSVCGSLDDLLLVKQLWEQALTYARYSAKAASAQLESSTPVPAASTGRPGRNDKS